jgi:hypothetical protein
MTFLEHEIQRDVEREDQARLIRYGLVSGFGIFVTIVTSFCLGRSSVELQQPSDALAIKTESLSAGRLTLTSMDGKSWATFVFIDGRLNIVESRDGRQTAVDFESLAKAVGNRKQP